MLPISVVCFRESSYNIQEYFKKIVETYAYIVSLDIETMLHWNDGYK